LVRAVQQLHHGCPPVHERAEIRRAYSVNRRVIRLSTKAGLESRIIDPDGFAGAIALERKRVERSGRLFVLTLIDLAHLVEENAGQEVVDQVLRVLSISMRETDVIGWHRNGSATLGIIFTEIASDQRKTIVSSMLSRVTGILYTKLSFEQFSRVSISQHVFPEEWDHDVPQRPSHPLLYPDLGDRETGRRAFSISKRLMDVTGSALGLLLCVPLFLIIALAIKLTSKGPVLFRQTRVGQYGKPFVFLKFRSMYSNNDPAIHQKYVTDLIAGRPERNSSSKSAGVVYKLARDPRITSVGGFLRKSSLDELPQLYNVLKGDMSLVGPRPAVPYEVEAYKPWHRRRVLEAKPGVTGLWQVMGRSRVTFDEMVRLDVRYAMARSLWLDLKILVQTPGAVISGSGAY
jgi:lipopolysaccharide/colanic/teichoic acid biosynthesis glycosyltransferase